MVVCFAGSLDRSFIRFVVQSRSLGSVLFRFFVVGNLLRSLANGLFRLFTIHTRQHPLVVDRS